MGANRRPTRTQLLLLTYGVLVALVGAAHFDRGISNSTAVMPTRARGMTASLAVLHAGGPPLLGATPAWAGSDPPAGTTYYDVGSADDPGQYFYLPLIGDAIGVDNPSLLDKWTFVLFMAVTLAIYPLVFYELLGSAVAAIAAPLLVIWRFGFLGGWQFYWMGAWAVMFCIPLLLLVLARPWQRRSVAAVCAIALLAGVASSFRGLAGTGVLLSCVLVAGLRVRPWRRLLPVILLVGVAYWAGAKGVIDGARHYRNHVVGYQVPQAHLTPLHNFYIGLGYVENTYGIHYADSVAARAALKVDPRATYESPRYAAALRHVLVNLWHRDPWFIVANIWDKTIAVTHDALRRFGSVLVLLPLAFAFARRRRFGLWLGLVAPSFVLLATPPISVMPYEQYELLWLGVWAFLWAAALLVLIARAEELVRSPAPLGRLRSLNAPGSPSLSRLAAGTAAAAGSTFRRRSFQLALLGSALALVLAHAPTARRVSNLDYWSLQTPLVASPEPGHTLNTWKLSTGVPSDWTNSADTAVAGAHGLTVTTTKSTDAYVLSAPAATLPAGRYEVVLHGRVTKGALAIGMLDVNDNALLESSTFWYGQSFRDRVMTNILTLHGALNVQLVLANLDDPAGVSRWVLQDISLRRLAS